MTKFLEWADSRHFISVRALTMYVTLYLAVDSYRWAKEYAYVALEKGQSGTEVGLIVGAVTIPLALFAPNIFKWYMEAKKET